jgi:hypothetical protein
MEKLAADTWRYRGSSVIFHHATLNSLIASQVSLRQALSWYNSLPDNPPLSSKTILVTGLETLIETMEAPEVEDFLVFRIQPLLRLIQNRWTDIGLVLAFTNPPQAFGLTVQEESLLFYRRDRVTVNLSNSLWDGSAPKNMRQIVTEGAKPQEEEIVGYHVSRIS